MAKGNAKVIPADPDAIFLPFQSKWILDKARIKLGEKSRQIGWTWATAYAKAERAARKDARVDVWISSRDELQAKLFIQESKSWAGVLDMAARDLGEIVVDAKEKHTAYVLEFANGRRIHSLSSNPDAQAGKVGDRVLDEFALHKDPRQLWSIAYPGITWGGNLEVFSTHRGSRNFFNFLIREILEGGNPKNISHHKVTLQDALDQGFLWKLQQMLPADAEQQAMDEAAYFDFVRSGCADEESFQQEYMCNPADDDSAFLEYDLIASAEYGSGVDWAACEGGELYLGIDIGRKKDLTVAWLVEKLGDVFFTRKVVCLEKMRKGEQERVLWPMIAMARRTCIDASGMGIGWTDDAQDQFGQYRVEGVTFTPAVKESLAYPLRGAFEDRKLRIPYDPKIRADLRQVTKSVTAAGNIRFTAERTPDGHSDRFWALALALHAGSTSGPPPASVGTDADPDTYKPDIERGSRSALFGGGGYRPLGARR